MTKTVHPGVFFALCLLFLTLNAGCRARVEAVMDDAFLKRGGEYWETFYLNEKPVGYQRTAVFHEEIDGKPVRRFQRQSRIVVLRYGKKVDLSMKIESLSSAEVGGGFVSCRTEIDGGGETIETRCRIDSGKLYVEGASNTVEKPWIAPMPGPESTLLELIADPMTVDSRRHFRYFEPALQRPMESTFHGARIDLVDFRDKPRKLLRINVENRIDGADESPAQLETLWTDAAGNILRRECSMGDGQRLVAVRTDRDEALAALDGEPAGELGSLGVVPLNRTVPNVGTATKLVFFVRMSQGRPEARFPITPFQNVEALSDGRTAKITVWSAVSQRPDGVGNTSFVVKTTEKPETVKPEDLASSRLIDLTDPKLLELAGTVDDNLAVWPMALTLERLVHDTVTKTDFSSALASSTETLRTRSGDCTEFAVLLAALCRAKKIPCRVVLGLVYTPFAPVQDGSPDDSKRAGAGMAFHLWNEVLVDGVWRPLDATLARGGADAGRIKIADDALADDSPAGLAGSVLDLLGRIQVNVAE